MKFLQFIVCPHDLDCIALLILIAIGIVHNVALTTNLFVSSQEKQS